MYEFAKETVDWNDVHLVVQEVDGLMDVKRTLLRSQAFETDPKTKKQRPVDGDDARMTMRLIVYPDYLSCLVESKGLPEPLDFESFIHLPKKLLDVWGAAVYRVNPDFLEVPQKEAAKKA